MKRGNRERREKKSSRRMACLRKTEAYGVTLPPCLAVAVGAGDVRSRPWKDKKRNTFPLRPPFGYLDPPHPPLPPAVKTQHSPKYRDGYCVVYAEVYAVPLQCHSQQLKS